MSATVQTARIEVMYDEDTDASWLEQAGYEDRWAAYQAGDFGFVGVRLTADLRIPHGNGWILQRVSTPGLWGIEDDSGDEYLREVACDEYHTLAAMLNELHVPTPVLLDLERMPS